MIRGLTKFVVLSALALVVAPGAMAQESWNWTLGLGAGAAPDYEGGDDYEAVPIPYFRAQKGYRYGELFGLHATSNVIDHPNWHLGPSLKFRQGYSDVDSNAVDDLKNRGGSFEAGAKGGYIIDLDQQVRDGSFLDLAVEFLHDVSGGHEGWVLTPSVTFNAPLASRWNFRTGVEASYASGSYMSHYFSINANESAGSGLDEYDADRDFKDVGLNVGVGYAISDHWNLLLLGQYKRMLGDAEDSPVVDDEGDENQFFGGAVVSYSWGG